MRALSMMQPYAWLVLQRYYDDDPTKPLKDVENRTWPLPSNFTLPQRIYIHASLGLYDNCLPRIHDLMTATQWLRQREALHAMYNIERTRRKFSRFFGRILGEIDITGCKFRLGEENDNLYSRWHFPGQYGFALTNPLLYREPVPCKGSLGFFALLPEVEAECQIHREECAKL